MKTIIFYFSGTGNSLVIARDLAKELEDAELIPIEKAQTTSGDLSSVKRIGFVYPVYMWGLPVLVANFIKHLSIPQDTYIFAVANCGGFQGNALNQTANILKQKGLSLSYGFSVRMPGNYTPMYGARSEKAQQKFFTKEKKNITQKTDAIKNKKTGYPKGFFLLNILLRIFYNTSEKRICTMDEKFWADEKCNSCSICAKVCPVNNIVMKENKPSWQHKCEQCLRCLHWCPQVSIQFGKSTVNKKRYHHPDVTLQDFLNL